MYTKLDAGQVFSGRPSGTPVNGFDTPSDLTPAVNPNYIMPPWLRYVALWFIHGNEPLYITGPTGCGKTSGVKQLAGRLNYPVYEITGHCRLETPELVGHHTIRNGDTVWVDGPLTAAMRAGGLFLLNEIDLLDPSTATGLNSVLDGSPLVIADNGSEVVKPAPGFRFVATANTNGSGDDTDLYVGTLRQNAAFQNRFVHVIADYLPPESEFLLLQTVAPCLPETIKKKMIRFTTAVRAMLTGQDVPDADLAKYEGAGLRVPIGTRTILEWAKWTEKFEPMKNYGFNVIGEALDFVIGNHCDSVSKNTLHELLQRVMGE